MKFYEYKKVICLLIWWLLSNSNSFKLALCTDSLMEGAAIADSFADSDMTFETVLQFYINFWETVSNLFKKLLITLTLQVSRYPAKCESYHQNPTAFSPALLSHLADEYVSPNNYFLAACIFRQCIARSNLLKRYKK